MIGIYRYGEVAPEKIFNRAKSAADVGNTVAGIIEDVRKRGDAALLDYTERFDGVRLSSLAVTEEEFAEAEKTVEPEFFAVLKEAAENIRAFHEKQKRDGFSLERGDGVVIGQRIIPIARAGLYVPGGTAAYPSTVLMDVIPAGVAGCEEVVITTPPDKNGKISPYVLAAAKTAGAGRVFKIGGAQAIAALAYGTESVPKVDKIVGPGNAFVAEAKRQVFGTVSIDMIAGPSEILIISDGKSDPAKIAADMLSQAEHDRLASAVLVTDSEELAKGVSEELERQIPRLLRRDIARASVDANGKIIIAGSIGEAIDIANGIAPEHLELCVDDPFSYLGSILNAGSVFLGRNCPEALGDYFAGPNHTLPTGGTARFSSPLSTDDFVKKTQFTYYSGEALARVVDKVALFAEKEGLTGHAESVRIRKEIKK